MASVVSQYMNDRFWPIPEVRTAGNDGPHYRAYRTFNVDLAGYALPPDMRLGSLPAFAENPLNGSDTTARAFGNSDHSSTALPSLEDRPLNFGWNLRPAQGFPLGPGSAVARHAGWILMTTSQGGGLPTVCPRTRLVSQPSASPQTLYASLSQAPVNRPSSVTAFPQVRIA